MGAPSFPPSDATLLIRLRASPTLPDPLRAAHNVSLSVPQSVGRKALNALLHTLLPPPARDFHFLAAAEPLRTTLLNFLRRRALSTETTLDLVYYLPLPPLAPAPPVGLSSHWLAALDATVASADAPALVVAGSFAGVPSIASADAVVVQEAALRHAAHAAAIKGVSWLPGATAFVSASADQTARLWDFDAERVAAHPVAAFRSDDAGAAVAFTSVAVSPSPDAPAAALGAANGSVWVLPALLEDGYVAPAAASTGKRKAPDERALAASKVGVTSHGLAVTGVRWRGKEVVTAGWDGLVRVWDVDACAPSVSIPCGGKAVTSLSVSDATMLVSSVDGAVRLLDARDGKGVVGACGRKGAHRGIVADACWIQSGRSAVSGGLDGTLRVWDLRAMVVPAHVQEGGHAGGKCLAVSFGGGKVFSAGSDGKVGVHSSGT